jgi:hypothetical protein
MRTTVDIPDETYRALKSKAASQGTSVKSLVLPAIENALVSEQAAPLPRLELPLIHGGEPGSLVLDNQRINELVGFP